ncbi:MAG: hypothetical protein OXH08_00545 [Gammaproteobacteria bacterium]|nr:hypothetical protein [Gammaproteobacteria bacterium]
MPILDQITAVAAFGGLLLGLLAAWRAFLDDRVRLRVTARLKKVDNSWLVDGGVDEVEFVKGFSSFGEEFVAISVTNMSKFPVALESVDLVLKDGGERGLLGVVGAIGPRRRKGLSYPLLEQYRPDQLGNVAPENVSSCRVRTECGLEIVKAVGGR